MKPSIHRHSIALRFTSSRRGLVLPLVLSLLPLAAAHAQWQTYDTSPPGGGQPWVFYDWRYPTPPYTYGGAWGVGNSWPTAGTSVTIRHSIELTNSLYWPTGNPNSAVEPFPGGAVFPGGTATQGLLTVNSLHIVPGGW